MCLGMLGVHVCARSGVRAGGRAGGWVLRRGRGGVGARARGRGGCFYLQLAAVEVLAVEATDAVQRVPVVLEGHTIRGD